MDGSEYYSTQDHIPNPDRETRKSPEEDHATHDEYIQNRYDLYIQTSHPIKKKKKKRKNTLHVNVGMYSLRIHWYRFPPIHNQKLHRIEKKRTEKKNRERERERKESARKDKRAKRERSFIGVVFERMIRSGCRDRTHDSNSCRRRSTNIRSGARALSYRLEIDKRHLANGSISEPLAIEQNARAYLSSSTNATHPRESLI